MSLKALNFVNRLGTREGDPVITCAEKCVLYALADRHDADVSCVHHPSTARAAAEACMSVRNFHRVIAKLEAKAVLKVARSRQPDGQNAVNRYYFIGLDVTLEGSDKVSLGVVTQCHQGSDTLSLGVVTPCHQGSDKVSPITDVNSQEQTLTTPAEEKALEPTVAIVRLSVAQGCDRALERTNGDAAAIATYHGILDEKVPAAARKYASVKGVSALVLEQQVLNHAALRWLGPLGDSEWRRLYSLAKRHGAHTVISCLPEASTGKAPVGLLTHLVKKEQVS